METVQPTMPEICTIWPFKEKFTDPWYRWYTDIAKNLKVINKGLKFGNY